MIKTGNISLNKRNAFIALKNKGFNFLEINVSSISALRTHRIAASAFFFIAGLTFATWASRIPDIQGKLHLNDAGLGAVLFALPVGLMVSLPLSGWLVSTFGSRKMVLAGALLYPLLLIPLSLADSVLQLTSALFLFGIASNLVNIAMNTQAVGAIEWYFNNYGIIGGSIFPYLFTATLGFLMVGFGVSSVVPVIYGMAGKSSSMPASNALAAVSTISFLGFLIGPPLIKVYCAGY